MTLLEFKGKGFVGVVGELDGEGDLDLVDDFSLAKIGDLKESILAVEFDEVEDAVVGLRLIGGDLAWVEAASEAADLGLLAILGGRRGKGGWSWGN